MGDRSPVTKGTLDVIVLRALAWGPMHGFEIVEWIDRTTNQSLDLTDAAVYQALYRMTTSSLGRGSVPAISPMTLNEAVFCGKNLFCMARLRSLVPLDVDDDDGADDAAAIRRDALAVSYRRQEKRCDAARRGERDGGVGLLRRLVGDWRRSLPVGRHPASANRRGRGMPVRSDEALKRLFGDEEFRLQDVTRLVVERLDVWSSLSEQEIQAIKAGSPEILQRLQAAAAQLMADLTTRFKR